MFTFGSNETNRNHIIQYCIQMVVVLYSAGCWLLLAAHTWPCFIQQAGFFGYSQSGASIQNFCKAELAAFRHHKSVQQANDFYC